MQMKERMLDFLKAHKNTMTWIAKYLGLFLVVECFQRASVLQGITYIFQHPLVSIYNIFLLVFLSFFILFLKRKNLGFVIYSIVWIGLSCASGIKADFRGDPLMAQDFFLLKEAGDVAGSYLSVGRIILIIVLTLIAVAAIVYVWKKEKYSKRFKSKYFVIAALVLLCLFPVASKGILNVLNINPVRWDMKGSYFKYGFAYSFAETVQSLKPEKPQEYSKETVKSIKNNIEKTTTAKDQNQSVEASNLNNAQIKPNVIGFLLEGFFDPTTLPGVTFSRDPIPNFRALMKNYTSGKMTVPVIGGGTVNTEFEVFTSMSTKLLSPGNTPYVQTLRTKSVESMPSVFRNNGYTTTAVHDHWGNFYNRVDVYKNIGFDRFISGETIANKTKIGGWTEDKVMLDPIKKVFNSQKGGNFIFGITVQTHGPYDGDKLITEDCPRVTSDVLSEREKIQVENYAYQLEQTDKFIKSIIDMINESGQPTVLFMYGDHLPSLGDNLSVYSKVNLSDTQKYQTPYVIWNNIGEKKQDEDINAYELAPKVFDCLGMEGTSMAQFQRKYKQGQASEEDFKLLEYDILYGKDYLYDESKPFEVKDIAIGLTPLKVTSVQFDGDKAVIKGTGFTEQSRVLKNNKIVDTTFVNTTTLEVDKKKISSGDTIEACYIDWKDGVYYKSPSFKIEK